MCSVFFLKQDHNKSIVINEVCSSNLKGAADSRGDHPDWVEIRNLTDREVVLEGYSIYAKGDELNRLEFDRAIIPPYGYVMTFTPFGISSKGDRLIMRDTQGRIIDAVSLPEMEYDTSYSRQENDSWIRTLTTPEYENSTEEISIATLSKPMFSRESGIYDEPFNLKLSCNPGERIFYTTDGSIPDDNSDEYVSGISVEDLSDSPGVYSELKNISPEYEPPSCNIDKATVIRAIAVNGEGEYSHVVTKIYFVWKKEKAEYKGKSIVAVTCDPDDLFSDDKGIYVEGDMYDEDDPNWSGNYYQRGLESEREADMCVFDEDHVYRFDQKVGIRIKGNDSRSYPQKSFNLLARKAYGDEYIKESLFKDVSRMKSFSLYACAQDKDAKIKDELASSLLKESNFETMEMKPAFLFLNGEYWGIYYIAERYDNTYIETHKGVKSEDVVMIKDPYEPQESEEMDLFNKMSDFIRNSDLSDNKKYNEFCDMADEDSMIDYYAAQFYMARLDDWPGYNEEFWRSRNDEDIKNRRWRPMLYDVNSEAMDITDVDNDTILAAIETGEHKIRHLMQNERFRNKLCDRIIELSQNEFAPDRVSEELERIKSDMELPMEGYYRRWYREGIPEERKIDAKVDDVRRFFELRGKYIIEYAEKYRNNPPNTEH